MCVALDSPVIETARLRLRAPQPADAARVAELCNDPDIPRMTTRMPWPYSLVDAVAFIGVTQGQDRARENTFLIEHGDDGPVGCIGIFTTGRLPELGYWVGRPYWGRGIATEATRAALAWAKSDWKKKIVVAGHFADNPASAAVLIKSGFLYTGEVEMRHSAARGEETPTRMMIWLA
jgi:RimJ/RimL family protein N-acetyltransferase